MSEPLTDAELERIQREHYPSGKCGDCRACRSINAPAPCDAARLVAEVRRLRALLGPAAKPCEKCGEHVRSSRLSVSKGAGARVKNVHEGGRVCEFAPGRP